MPDAIARAVDLLSAAIAAHGDDERQETIVAPARAQALLLRRKAAAFDRYYELELTHVERGHRPWLPAYVLTEIHGIANGTREADHA